VTVMCAFASGVGVPLASYTTRPCSTAFAGLLCARSRSVTDDVVSTVVLTLSVDLSVKPVPDADRQYVVEGRLAKSTGARLAVLPVAMGVPEHAEPRYSDTVAPSKWMSEPSVLFGVCTSAWMRPYECNTMSCVIVFPATTFTPIGSFVM